MFVKTYRYRIEPGKVERYVAIQEQTSQLYKKHFDYRSVHLRSRKDPSQWLEIHWYPDQATYRDAIGLVNAEPEIAKLWEEFQTTLDPGNQAIEEEDYDQVRSDGNLPT